MLLAAYAAAVAVRPSDDGPRLSAAEAHRLLVADSIVHDGDLEVADEYRDRVWDGWDTVDPLRPAGTRVGGRLLEPAGIGTPLLVAPAHALAGPVGAQLWCAALLALAFALGAAVARRVVPDPWATRAALLFGLSPPALATAVTVGPDAAAAAVVTGAALLALKVREEPRMSWAAATGALLATLPWLSLRALAVGAVVAAALFRWLRRRNRALAGFVALELLLTSAVVYVSVNDRLFGGPAPAAARRGDGPLVRVDVLDVLAVLRWAPIVALCGVGAWLLWRSRRDRLAVVSAPQVDIEVAAALCTLLLAVSLAVAALVDPALGDAWVVPGTLVVALPAAAAPAAWGLRFAPRTGAALAALTLAQSAGLITGLL